MDMREYLNGLCGSLEQALCSHRPVRLTVSAEPIALPPDKALPVGLMVNELVTNALKYAFPDERAGTVGVQLERHGNTARLSVADNGVGCAQEGRGLGTKLVKLLAVQLGGEAKWEALKPGCRVVTEISLT
jgi:two-component sensor histidine kinase